ncbi:hypothetical protein [Candidatus Methylomicrobium oryzae]|uniref:hypothetical protein n=1 Tax=Candidatus Methylomicrobium oryzae TaxID=2802053 RepID=UPI001923786C|nr:hypothetical protein [Methylomicrobium sp. RS1]MBL1265743.1 hypothetical protein [Methylomicrobium sp. RS1]
MAIQKEFILRYRGSEHVRFEIPSAFCTAGAAEALTGRLLAVDGIYRVQVYRSQKKLVIRYQETVHDFVGLCRLLFRIVSDLEKDVLAAAKPKALQAARQRVGTRFKNLQAFRWFGRKYDDARETLQAAKIVGKGLTQPGKFFKDPEKMVIDFLNDVLVLFLIRLHWDHITKEWIPRPLKYRYEWMAVFYMIYLLMRSRRPR